MSRQELRVVGIQCPLLNGARGERRLEGFDDEGESDLNGGCMLFG